MTWMPRTPATPLARRRAHPTKKRPGPTAKTAKTRGRPRGPAGCAIAAEMEERRLDIAERNILEALTTDDPRMRMASAMITVRYSAQSPQARLDHQFAGRRSMRRRPPPRSPGITA